MERVHLGGEMTPSLPSEPHRELTYAVAYTQRAAGVVVSVSTVAIVTALATTIAPLFGLGAVVLPVLALAVAMLISPRLLAWMLSVFSQRIRPAVVAVPVLLLFATLAALWLPQVLVGFSEGAEWSYRVAVSVSLIGPLLASLATAALARVSRYSALGVVALAVVTLALSVVARDAGVNASRPDWCYADSVSKDAEGVELRFTRDGCAILLPGREGPAPLF